MKLNLKKPLVIFDLETTGLDLVKSRIIQISYIKVYPDGREERGDTLINPEETIPPFVTQLTGISNDDVKDKPTFKQIASKLGEMFTGCDFGGFNSNVRETDKWINSESSASGNDIVGIQINVESAQSVILEEVDELRSDTPVGGKLILHLCAKSGHGVLGRVNELCGSSDIALLSVRVDGCSDGDNGHEDVLFHMIND